MARLALLSRLRHVLCYYVPAIAKPLFSWLLGFSETSSSWHPRTALMVAIARAIFNDPTRVSMLEEQRASFSEEKITSAMWVCKDEFPVAGNNNLAEVVTQAVSDLSSDGTDTVEVTATTVEGEWIGHKPDSGGSSIAAGHAISCEEQRYSQLIKDKRDCTVMIYLHGGQFYLRNPASRRGIVHELVQRTDGLCFSMAYRLSPQHLFPSALVDLLVVYLSLLYPSPGSVRGISADSICICGDSSGGNIAVAFLQLILHLRRLAAPEEPILMWNGNFVQLPCPGAICTHSGYMDLTRSLPSELANLKFDIIPSPSLPPAPPSRYLQDAIWPPEHPRHHVYAATSLLTHPLVSPITAEDWRGCPTRVWLSVGQECLMDGSVILAKKMAEDGVHVELEVYHGMPHDFLVLLRSSASGQECLDRWAAFVKHATTAKGPGTKSEGRLSSALIRRPDGTRDAVELEIMEPRRTRDELVDGMKAQINQWGPPWLR